MSAWKSRWSCDRLVNAPTAKRVPATRPSASAWLDTSIATSVTPPSSITANSACRSGASGVVNALGSVAPATRTADGADQPGGASGRGQPRLEQVRHGGLAAGPGDAEHAQAAASGRRRRSRRPSRAPRGAAGAPTRAAPWRRRGSRAGGVGEDGDGACGARLLREVGAMGAGTGQGREEVAGPDLGGPQRHPADRDAGVHRTGELGADDVREDVQVHAPRSPRPGRRGSRGDGGGAGVRHVGRLPAPMIAPDRRPTSPEAAQGCRSSRARTQDSRARTQDSRVLGAPTTVIGAPSTRESCVSARESGVSVREFGVPVREFGVSVRVSRAGCPPPGSRGAARHPGSRPGRRGPRHLPEPGCRPGPGRSGAPGVRASRGSGPAAAPGSPAASRAAPGTTRSRGTAEPRSSRPAGRPA